MSKQKTFVLSRYFVKDAAEAPANEPSSNIFFGKLFFLNHLNFEHKI